MTAVKTAAPVTCPAGYYSDASVTTCTQCPNGFYCPDGILKITCTSGSYCPLGSSAERVCPLNMDCLTYSSTPCTVGKMMQNGVCVSCPKDFVCILRDSTLMVPVTSGYYSPTDVNVEYICPGGWDCTNANSVKKCNTGWFSIEGDLACTECTAPYACYDPALALIQQIDCSKVRGYYQQANG